MIKQTPHLREPAGSARRSNSARVLFAVLGICGLSRFRALVTGVVFYTRTRGVAITAVLALMVFGGFTAMQLVQPKPALAAPANTINFQARLETSAGSIAADGNYNVRFKLYSVNTGGTALWTESYLVNNSTSIRTANGYVTANLGINTAFPSGINWGQQLYLTMEIGGTGTTATWDGEMSPRLALTSVPSAFALNSYNSANGFTGSLTVGQPTGGSQTFVVPDQGAAGSYTLLTTTAANSGYIQNQSASPQTGANFYIAGTGRAATGLQAPLIDAISSGTLGVGTQTSTTGLTLGRSGIVTTNAGTFTSSGLITASNGVSVTNGLTVVTGSQFTNASSTLLTARALTLNTNGDIGANTATVDTGSTFNITSTATNRNYTLPTPSQTGAAGAGRLVYISNVGTNSFSMYGVSFPAGTTQGFLYNGSIWTLNYVQSSGNFIQNSTTQQTSADFNIDGNGTLGSLTVTGLSTLGAATLTGVANINTTGTATTNIGNASSTTTITGPTNINTTGTGATNIGTSASANSITVGSANTTLSITSTGFSAATNGNITAGTYNGQTISSTASFSGTLAVSTLGSANTASYLCRNSTNQLAACTGGAPFAQGGNSFGATGVLGTNDNFGLQFETNGVTRFTLDTAGTGTLTGNLAVQGTGASTFAGSLSAVGVNANTGLLQGTGGVTISGAANINTTGTAATNIGTGSTGSIAIGNTTAATSVSIQGGTTGGITLGGTGTPLAINSTNFKVTSAGVAGGLTGLSSSGTIAFSGLSTAGIVTNTAAGVLGTISSIPVSQGGTGLTATPLSGQLAIGNGTGYTLATLTQGSNISITNGAGSISLATTQNPTFTTSVTTPLLTSTGALTVQSAAGQTLTVDSGTTANLLIGTAANAKIVRIGNNTGATGVEIITGSAGLTVTGNTTVSGTYNTNTFTGTALTFGGASGTVTGTNLALRAAGAGTLTLDSASAGGTIALGTNAATINLGGGTSAETINLGNSTGADTVNIATGGGTDAVNIGTNSTSATTIVQGSTNTGTTARIQGGASYVYVTNNGVGIGTTAPVTALDVNGSLSMRYNNVRNYYGVYSSGTTTAGTTTGTFELALPNLWTGTMLRFRLTGYNQSTGAGWTATVSGYNNAAGGWTNTSAEVSGNPPFSNVRLARLVGGNSVLLLGNTATIWSTPQIVLDNVVAGFSNQDIWGDGYTSSYIGNEAGRYQNSSTVTVSTLTGSATGFVQDGNSFGTNAILGTNDNFGLEFETNNVTRLTIGATGAATFNGQIISSVANGTAPLVVASTTKVTNLNADLLDGLDSTAFALASGSSAGYIQNTTTQQASSNFNISGNGVIGGTLTVTGLAIMNGGIDVLGTSDITGTLTLNTAGTAATSIGNSTAATAVTLLGGSTGGVNINTSGTGVTRIGNVNSTTTILGAVIINGSGNDATSIGTGSTGAISIGNTTAATSVNIQGGTTGGITIGGATTPLTISSTGLKVTSAGIATGLTGLTSSGTITFSGLANGLVSASGGVLSGGTIVGVASGGTGLTATPANGQLAIGNGSGYTMATITQGSNLSITNGSGSITIGTIQNPTFTTSVTTPLVTSSGALTIQSAAGQNLNLNTGTAGGTIVTNAGTIQRNASGTTSIDLNAAGTTVLRLLNSGSGVADFNLFGGDLTTGAAGTTRLTNAGALTNITGYTQTSGSTTISQNAADQFKIQASAVPTTDMAVITNVGRPVTTGGINGLQVDYYGGAAAVESSAGRFNITPGTTSGGIWNGVRIVAGAPAAGVTANGIKLETTAGTGTQNALYVGTGWNNILNYNGTSIINGTGVLQSAGLSGTYGNAVSFTNTGNTYFGSGASLTALNATNLSSGTVNDARLSTNVAKYNDVTANFTGTLQNNGNLVCNYSGNCSDVNTTTLNADGYFKYGGNLGGINALLGTNDNFSLTLRTNNANRLTVDTAGNVNILGGALQVSGTTVLTGGRALQNLTAITSSGAITFSGLTAAGIVTNTAGGVLGTTQFVPVANGGTGAGTFTQYGVLYGNGTSPMGVTGAGSTGQCLISNSGAAPTFGSCAGSASGVTLQAAYNNSVAANPEITLDATRTTMDIQAYSGQIANLLSLRAYAASGLGASLFAVSSAGAVTASGALTVIAGGADITGGLALNNGGISSTGSLAGVTGIATNGAYSQTGTGANSFSGTVAVATLGTAGSSVLCRNASNQLASCSGNGAPFVQGGNSFGATAILGTNDNNSLAFETNGTTRLTLDTSGGAAFTGAITGVTNFTASGDILAGGQYTRSFTRAMPTVVDDTVDLGSFVFTVGAANLQVYITVPSTGFSDAKQYMLPIRTNATGGAWQIAQALNDTGGSGANDYALDLNSTGSNLSLRLRRISGSTVATAYVTIVQQGNTNNPFTASSATGSVIAPTAYYAHSVISQGSGSVLLQGSINVANGGVIQTAGVTRLTAAGVLQNVTADAAILTTGSVNSARLTGSYTGITAVGTLTSLTVSGQITSTIANGTAPLVVTSSTKVINLNADLLDGLDSSAFATASGSGSYIQNTTTQQAGSNFNISGNGVVGGTLTVTGRIISNVATGTAPLTVTSTTMVSNLNVEMLEGQTGVQIAQNLRANVNLTGGGTVSYDGSNLQWSARFIVMANGRGTNSSTAGYFDITMPTSGTVTGVGGATNQTATASGIPLAAWTALYYILPNGSGNASTAANFRLVSYTANLNVPSDWVLLAIRNGDDNTVRVGTGVHLRSGQSATQNGVNNAIFNTSVTTSALNVVTAGGTLSTNVGTIQRVASGTTSIDLQSASDTILRVINSGSGVADLNIYGGDLTTGAAGTVRLTNAGNLQNIGTYTGSGALAVTNTIQGTRLISTVASGTAPLTVASNTLVTNLNSDLLDGLDSTAFAAASGSGSYIQNTNTQQAGANFNISGNGTLGGTLTAAGLAVQGTTNINTTGAATTNIGTTATANAVNIGTSNTTLAIASSGFSAATNGNVTAGTYNGQTITSAASLTGTLAVAGLLTGNAGATFNLGAGERLNVVAAAASTQDLLTIANAAGTATTGDQINGQQVTWYAAPNTSGFVSSAGRFNVFNTSTTAGTQVQGIRIDASGAGTTIASDTVGLMIDALARVSSGSTSENAIEIGGGWDNIIQSANFAVTQSGVITGNGSLLTALNGTNITTGTVANTRLTGSGALTVAAGTGLSGGGSVALGGTTTLNIANTTVSTGSYGSATNVATFTVNAQGQLTAAASPAISIALSGTNTTGTLTVARGGTNTTTIGAAGAVAYSNGTSYAFSPVGTSGYCLTSAGAGQPTWSQCSNGVTTVGTFNAAANGNGLSISGNTITLHGATASSPGGVSTGIQTFGGAKTFSGTVSVIADGGLLVKPSSTNGISLLLQNAAGTNQLTFTTGASTGVLGVTGDADVSGGVTAGTLRVNTGGYIYSEASTPLTIKGGIAGNQLINLDGSQVAAVSNGFVATPGYTFASNLGAGMYINANNFLAFAKGGSQTACMGGGYTYIGSSANGGCDSTANADYSLRVAGGAVGAMTVERVANGTLINFNRSGTNVGDITVSGGTVSYNAFTGSHLAKVENGSFEYGTLSRLTGNNDYQGNSAEPIYGIEPSHVANDPNILGAYNDKKAEYDNRHLVMAAGNGDVWVADNGTGNVKIGDPLISSGVIDGFAQRDPKTFAISHVFAKAAEKIDWSQVTTMRDGVKIKRVNILFSYYDSENLVGAVQLQSLNVNNNALIGGNVSIARNLNVMGATTLTSLKVTGSVTIDGTLTVQGPVSVGTLTVNGHVISSGNAPLITVGTALGEGIANQLNSAPIARVEGTDTAGSIILTSGTVNRNNGVLAKIDFAEGFGAAMQKTVISATNENATDLRVYVVATATGFEVRTRNAPDQNKEYRFDYIVIGAQGAAVSP